MSESPSRAEFLRILVGLDPGEGSPGEEALALRLGFDLRRDAPAEEKAAALHRLIPGRDEGAEPQPKPKPEGAPDALPLVDIPFLRPVAVEYRAEPRESEAIEVLPESFFEVPEEGESAPVAPPPLAPMTRLWPALLEGTRRRRQRSALDLDRLIHDLSRGSLPRRLPRKEATSWPDRLLVVVDRSPYLTPIFRDQLRVLSWLGARLPAGSMELRALGSGPNGEVIDPLQPRVPASLDATGRTVLVMGDLGLTRDAEVASAWDALAREFASTGNGTPNVLLAAPQRLWSSKLGRLWHVVPWDDRTAEARPSGGQGAAIDPEDSSVEGASDPGVSGGAGEPLAIEGGGATSGPHRG